jgi:hypothetical protein
MAQNTAAFSILCGIIADHTPVQKSLQQKIRLAGPAGVVDEHYIGSRSLCGEIGPSAVVLRSAVDKVPAAAICPLCRERVEAGA